MSTDLHNIETLDDYVSEKYHGITESLLYHIDQGIPITQNIFRPGSRAFFGILYETRKLFDKSDIRLHSIDQSLFENTDIGRFGWYGDAMVPLDLPMDIEHDITCLYEADTKGKKVKLNHPMRGGTKKYYVYVRNPKSGNIKKISFGDVHGGLKAKVSDPEARRNFAARHQCHTKKDKTKAGYWACRINRYGHLWGGKTYGGYW